MSFLGLFSPVKKLKKVVAAINAIEPEITGLDDVFLLNESKKLQQRARDGESVDALLPRAFALVRETAKRTLKQRHYDVQLMGGIVLAEGKIAEMRTGEGKTLAATAPAYLRALKGEGVHVVTVNEYLAKRDAVWMGQIYHALGLKVACLIHEGALMYDPDFYERGPRGPMRTNADNDDKLLYADLTYKLRGLLFDIKKKVGLGHKELVYQNILEQELQKAGLAFEREKILDIHYEGKKVGVYKPDFIIDNKVIVELKSLPFLGKVEKNQLQTYLKASAYKLGLLVNLGGKDIEIDRVIYDQARNNAGDRSPQGPLESAESALLDEERDTTGAFLVQDAYLRPISRREAYAADITYGTNHEFGFDYLRDNLVNRAEDQVQRGWHYAIIDEVDSILIDEARTPLIISAPDSESSELYKTFTRVVSRLEKGADYLVDEKEHSANITEAGIDKVEQVLNIKNIYAPENLRLTHYLQESLKAYGLYLRDRDYVSKDGEIIIVDQFTGRLMMGRRYSGGLHQAIEAKEGVRVNQESRTYAQISIQNYFRLYEKLGGMTGTAQTSAEEFDKVYKLEVVTIPTNRDMIRKDEADLIYKTVDAKYDAIIADIKARHEKGQPVLIGTVSIEKNEELARRLSRAGIPHEVLNAKNNEREGSTIAQAGRVGAVTVATNMAGRGVDIILSGNPPEILEAQKVREAGGLHVIGTERHEARRIDNQLRGRAGRQGDPGSSQFFLSLEDDLMRIFAGERLKRLMERLNVPDDMPISAGIISRAISEAQSRVEGFHFDSRKHLLEYDDVLNRQRLTIYKKRQEMLASHVIARSEATKQSHASRHSEPAGEESHEIAAGTPAVGPRNDELSLSPSGLAMTLAMLDMLWMNHLSDMEALGDAVRLRAYGQHDPLVEYKREGHIMFKQLLATFEEWILENKNRLVEAEERGSATRKDAENSSAFNPRNYPRQSASIPNPYANQKIGRNEPCPCGAKKEDGAPVKYKHCHGKNI